MKILIASDSHQKSKQLMNEAAAAFPQADLRVHLGDRNGYRVDGWIEVNGNTDEKYGDGSGETERVIEAGQHRILLIHGHLFGPKNREEKIAQRAEELGCDLAFYGHTHRFCDRTVNGIRIINPGAMIRPSKGETAGFAIFDTGSEKLSYISLKALCERKKQLPTTNCAKAGEPRKNFN